MLYTICRTPRTGDQPVTRPLPTHRINAHRHPRLGMNSNSQPCVCTGEDNSCLRPLLHLDKRNRLKEIPPGYLSSKCYFTAESEKDSEIQAFKLYIRNLITLT
jgi:hypothetical protein